MLGKHLGERGDVEIGRGIAHLVPLAVAGYHRALYGVGVTQTAVGQRYLALGYEAAHHRGAHLDAVEDESIVSDDFDS